MAIYTIAETVSGFWGGFMFDGLHLSTQGSAGVMAVVAAAVTVRTELQQLSRASLGLRHGLACSRLSTSARSSVRDDVPVNGRNHAQMAAVKTDLVTQRPGNFFPIRDAERMMCIVEVGILRVSVWWLQVFCKMAMTAGRLSMTCRPDGRCTPGVCGGAPRRPAALRPQPMSGSQCGTTTMTTRYDVRRRSAQLQSPIARQ